MRNLNNIITVLNIIMIFATPCMILLHKYKVDVKRQVQYSILLSIIPALTYFIIFKPKEKNNFNEYLEKVQIWANKFKNDYHYIKSKKGYEKEFNNLENINEQKLNKFFTIGFYVMDRSQKAIFFSSYSKLLIKSPETCYLFSTSKLFFNEEFFKNYEMLDKNELETIQRISADSFLNYFKILAESEDETQLNEIFEKEIESIKSNINKLNEDEIVNSGSIDDLCRKNISKMNNILGEDLLVQDKNINQYIGNSWKVVKSKI